METIYHGNFEIRKSKTVQSYRFEFRILALVLFNNDSNANAVRNDQLKECFEVHDIAKNHNEVVRKTNTRIKCMVEICLM